MSGATDPALEFSEKPMARSIVLLASAIFLTLLCSCATRIAAPHAERILLVGNSVLYTNNLPAVMERMAAGSAPTRGIEIEMIARGGASLSDWQEGTVVSHTVRSGAYSAVLLQERGGDVLCVLSEPHAPECEKVNRSHRELAALARAHGAKVIYLGTYQLADRPSRAIVKAERRLAEDMGADYVEVSEVLRRLRELKPHLPWLHADGGHPGIATTLLMASLVYVELKGTWPAASDLCTDAELYSPGRKFEGLVKHKSLVMPTQQRQCLLTKEEVAEVLSLARQNLSPTLPAKNP